MTVPKAHNVPSGLSTILYYSQSEVIQSLKDSIKKFINILRLSVLKNYKIIKSSKYLRSHGEIRVQEIKYLKLKM